MWVASAKLSEKLSLQVASMVYYSYLSEKSVLEKKENNICDMQRYNSTHITAFATHCFDQSSVTVYKYINKFGS
mgnify:CR=1 FL=1